MVYGLLRTARGSSPIVSVTDVALSLGGFTLLYTVLGVIDVVLMARTARAGLDAGAAGGHGAPVGGQPADEELIY
jgi:cytochrome d ubiquinol oxidase subunit I